MANLEDLSQKSITEMSVDEQLELIRQIRLQRRTPERKTTKPKTSAATKISKAPMPEISADLAKKLLEKLGGSK